MNQVLQENSPLVSLADLPESSFERAGGKAANLAKMIRLGFTVPEGLVLLPDAFEGEELAPHHRETLFAKIAPWGEEQPWAVRSSAIGEDAADASYAGGFSTVLDVQGREYLLAAIKQVRESRHNARALAYSQAITGEASASSDLDMAVIVQRLVPAEWSGVLFSADPLTADRRWLTGQFVAGLGERLVAGETNGEKFRIHRLGAGYQGPSQLRKAAMRLFEMAIGMEELTGLPQDMEWTVAKGRVYALQSRPITTLRVHDRATGSWNHSHSGDYLWTNTNLGEGIPDVMTPLTWTLLRQWINAANDLVLPGSPPTVGNIAGRMYYNLTPLISLHHYHKRPVASVLEHLRDVYGKVPGDITVPIDTYRFRDLFPRTPLSLWRTRRRLRRDQKALAGFLAEGPEQVQALKTGVAEIRDAIALSALWREEVGPFSQQAFRLAEISTLQMQPLMRLLRTKLSALVDEDACNDLLSVFGGENIESMASILGLAALARGEISGDEYMVRHGHRFESEFEMSLPRPAEDEAWLEKQDVHNNVQLQEIAAMAQRQQERREDLWAQLQEKHPKAVEEISVLIDRLAKAGRERELARSHLGQVLWLARTYFLQAGRLTGLNEDIFHLYLDEVLALLRGDREALAYIPARKATMVRNQSLPPLPNVIRGRFDPFKWAADPHRRRDAYDAEGAPVNVESDLIQGFAGASGVVEGVVRVLESLADAKELQPGEILVTVTTNVGWTPLFPKAAAVVTDVGAPLSHAAIVARELGLPAVVGCGGATTVLKTGDWVRVHGGRGTVERL